MTAPDRSAGPQPAGSGIIRLSVGGTVAFVAVTTLASFWGNDAADLANLAVSGVLFVGGSAAFGLGFLRAAGRSRAEDVDIAGVVYLTGSAPTRVRRTLLGLWFVQIATATASVFAVRPPFGVMAPVCGIGLITVWGSRHGVFPPRPAADGRRRRPTTSDGTRPAPSDGRPAP